MNILFEHLQWTFCKSCVCWHVQRMSATVLQHFQWICVSAWRHIWYWLKMYIFKQFPHKRWF